MHHIIESIHLIHDPLPLSSVPPSKGGNLNATLPIVIVGPTLSRGTSNSVSNLASTLCSKVFMITKSINRSTISASSAASVRVHPCSIQN
jgi:hypothetical protein